MENSVKELLEALKEKGTLIKGIEKLWKNGETKKIVEFLENVGIKADIETVEKTLAEFQKKTAEKIQNGKIDDNQLEAVTGGGMGFCSGPADCDKFLIINQEIPYEERCFRFYSCDENYHDANFY